MIENRAEQTQVAPDEEIRINVVEDNYDEQCKIDDGIADYLASPEGAWGRSGT